MKKALLVLDVQEEFLGERLDYIEPLCQKYLDEHGNDYDAVILTQWRHEQNKDRSTLLLSHKKAHAVDKVTFSGLNDEVRSILEGGEIEEVHIAGVDAELAVLATMFALLDAGYEVKVLERLVSSFNQLSWEAMRIARTALGKEGVLQIAGGRVFL